MPNKKKCKWGFKWKFEFWNKMIKRGNENGQGATVVFGTPISQERSLLMKLPRELRDEIYYYVFFSILFFSGKRGMDPINCEPTVPDPNALSLLRSCRQVYFEVGKSWLGQVEFCFENMEAMLDKLANISLEMRSMIRYVRVSGKHLLLRLPETVPSYHISQSLKLLSGMKLDRLTVVGSYVCDYSYETLEFLINYSDGWKELYYISWDSCFLGYASTVKIDWLSQGSLDGNTYLRVPQPAGWQENLENRDGADSGSSVTIYRSRQPSVRPGSVMYDRHTRTEFTQNLSPEQDAGTYGLTEDPQLMAPGEREKEVLVVVKRGSGVDYEEKQDSPYHPYDDFRKRFPGKGWREIGLYIFRERLWI
ncbi:hypothetical protein PT974_01888 [Cladobotryum mycophilum]|uniref:F-box domain-containing protein n=1 Tax=Cladobotryum mycophilum TaxID=491253 RepID=A0ABR0SWK8_9HYPO